MASLLTPLKGVSKHNCAASTEGKALRDYIGRYTAGSKIIVHNEVPVLVGLNVSWQLERPIARLRSKNHL